LPQNDQVNRDAAKDVPTPTTEDGGSGSTFCSFSAIRDFVEFKQKFYVRTDGKNYYPIKPSDDENIETQEVEVVVAVVRPCQVVAIISDDPRCNYCTLILNGGTKIDLRYSIQDALALLSSSVTRSGEA
jgi:hypothetical protein